MNLMEEVNKAKKAINDATFGLSQQVDSAMQAASEAVKQRDSMLSQITAMKQEQQKLASSILSLKDEKANLEAAVGDLKSFLEKHLKVGA